MVKHYAKLALDGCLEDDYPLREANMKVKTTFYNHKVGVDYNPVISVSYPKNRADQLSHTPTAKLVDQMFRTGQMVLASKALYDFPDGKDDGRDVPVDRLRGLDYPEVSQAMLENEQKLEEHSKRISAMSKKSETKKDAAVDSKDVSTTEKKE